MERECFLTILIALTTGVTVLVCGWWPIRHVKEYSALRLERFRWKQVWVPLIPAAIVAAWLCGWALVEPDPTPEAPPAFVILASVGFALLLARAVIRAGWALFRDEGDPAVATVGIMRPWILFSPHLAKALDDCAIEAALEHERAHARHRDPLRIWLAQLATDLQWPWPQAQKRFREWILALEFARDDEARAAGIDGSDLATAVLATVRFRDQASASPSATLAGQPSVLKERIARLLNPLADQREAGAPGSRILWLLAACFLLAVGLGSAFGERVIGALLRLAA
jgi:BlaR1 peptidase M56